MCNNPLYRLSGLYLYKLKNYAWVNKRVRNNALILNRDDYLDVVKNYGVPEDAFQKIPCGNCQGCRFDYSRQWTSRAVLESYQYQRKAFITLTYDDAHLPIKEVLNDITGEVIYSPVLVKRDFQLFAKRLRKACSKKGLKIRFFGSGEYGDKLGRPHFHAIVYGYDFPDKQVFFWEKNGGRSKRYTVGATPYYRSDELERLWTNGYSLVAAVNSETCRYVANYECKQPRISNIGSKRLRDNFLIETSQTSPHLLKRLQALRLIQMPYLITPRRPGLARDFYEKHKNEIYSNDVIPYKSDSRGLARHIRYFDNLFNARYAFFNDVHPRLKAWREIRKARAMPFQLSFVDLQAREELFKARVRNSPQRL